MEQIKKAFEQMFKYHEEEMTRFNEKRLEK